MYDYYVAFAVTATGTEESPVAECELTELACMVVDASSGVISNQRVFAITPTYQPWPLTSGAVSFEEAMALCDQFLDDTLRSQGASFVLVTDGPFPLRRAVKLEAAAKGVALPAHWSVYFDLRKEAMRLRSDCASSLTSLDAVMQAFGLDLPLDSCTDRATATAAVLQQMVEQGSPPNQRPQQIPHGDVAQLDRQWHSSPVSRHHIQNQQHAAQQKAAHVIGLSSDGGGAQRMCVRMRGLPFQATPTDVVRFFHGLQIAEPDGIQFLYNLQGKSKGEAFVEFASEADAAAAAKRDKQFMGERYIEVFPATLQDMRYCLAQSNPSTAGSTIVRCRGMPYNTSADDIVTFFRGCDVVDGGVSLCLGGDDRPTGEAFVQFRTEADTSRALSRHRCHLGGRYVEIFRSSKQEMVNQCQQRLRALGHKRGAARPHSPQVFSPHIARLRGLPFSLNEMDVAALFSGLGICRQGIHMMYSADEKPTGEAFVEFESATDVDAAVAKHKSPIGHRYVEVFRSTPDEVLLACGDHDPSVADQNQLLVAQPTAQPLLLPPPTQTLPTAEPLHGGVVTTNCAPTVRRIIRVVNADNTVPSATMTTTAAPLFTCPGYDTMSPQQLPSEITTVAPQQQQFTVLHQMPTHAPLQNSVQYSPVYCTAPYDAPQQTVLAPQNWEWVQ